MSTARSPRHSARDRGAAVPFRLLWPTLLVLFGVLLVHGAGAENAGHAASSVPVMAVNASVHAGHSDHGEHPGPPAPVHSHELCVSGHPQQGGELTPPCPAPGTTSAVYAAGPVRAAAARGVPLPPPLRSATGSVVQQV
ncbi:hypothetical protein [Streptomyces natalensis]|uniref:Uncharacterized protein n=1 Tax=Streptomyces natalensis ATCC 27448 TaxID=1240678 RepID=A0A0D7CF16_9ACTN|nr:hypothetical protein [Streptomyces natalensis]KIZ14773.1 hypothetical protein SNA_30285 [Streptomyces natalensis ATCC 27448]